MVCLVGTVFNRKALSYTYVFLEIDICAEGRTGDFLAVGAMADDIVEWVSEHLETDASTKTGTVADEALGQHRCGLACGHKYLAVV